MSTRIEQLAQFYLAEHARLERIVGRDLPADAVEDACHTAWCRCAAPTSRSTVKAWRGFAGSRSRPDAGWRSAGASSPSAASSPTPISPASCPSRPRPRGDLADRATERLHHRAKLAVLPARQRRLLALQAVGLTYTEIAEREGCTLRTVERQLLRAKRTLREPDTQP